MTDRIYLIGGGAYGYSDPGDCDMYLVDCGGTLSVIDAPWTTIITSIG